MNCSQILRGKRRITNYLKCSVDWIRNRQKSSLRNLLMGHKVESFVQKDWNDIADYMERRRLHSIFQLSHIIILTSLVLYRKISSSYDSDIIMTIAKIYYIVAAPEINISPVPDIVSGSRHFVPVTRDSRRSSVFDILLKFENLPVIVTGRKRILSVTHEIVPDSDWWPAVISCTVGV